MVQLVDRIEGLKKAGQKIREDLQEEMMSILNEPVHTLSLRAQAMESHNTTLEELVVFLHQQVKEMKT